MSRLALSKLGLMSAAVSFAAIAGADAQSAPVPNFDGGVTGWVHVLNATFPPVPGSPSPVVQDPGHPFGAGSWRIGDLSNPNLKPWVKDVMKKDNDEIDRGKIAFQARSSCLPSGIPNMFLPGNPLLVVQSPKEVLMIWPSDQQVRHVYMNVPHTRNPKPSWYGESVGRYEGDELVVDTIGLSDKSFVDNYRTPHTTQMHVVERLKLVDAGKTLQINIEVEDPGTFTMKWQAVQRFKRWTEGPMAPSACAENNFDYFTYKVEPIPQAAKPDF